jgi:hypothetical protein
MQKLLVYFLVAVFATSCNNDKTKEATASADDKKTGSEVKPGSARLDCSSFLMFKKGTVLEYNTTGAKGRVVAAVTTTTIDDVRNEGNAVVADYTSAFKDKKIRSTYRCEDGVLSVDMKSMFQDLFSGFSEKSGVTVEVQDGYLSYPLSLKEGDDLKDADFELKTKKDGKDMMTMKSQIKNRKVVGEEKITTPAGTWDCIKMDEKRIVTMSMMGNTMPPKELRTTTWFAPGGGLVKTETYDEKGELITTTELISVK